MYLHEAWNSNIQEWENLDMKKFLERSILDSTFGHLHMDSIIYRSPIKKVSSYYHWKSRYDIIRYVAMIISFNIFWSYCIIAWQVGWALILLAVTIGLIAILIYYFVFVFSTAVYSRVVIESPDNDGNIIISKVAFIYNHLTLSKELLKCLQFHFYSINCY